MNDQNIPQDWSLKSIGETCDILDSQRVPLNNEQRASMKGQYPYYGANGLVDNINSYIYDEDLILIAEDGGFFDDFRNRPIAYKISGKSWVNNHAHVLRAKDNNNQDFIFYLLEHKDITFYISGGTRQKLNQSQLKRIPFVIPNDPAEQRAIADILSMLDEAIAQSESLVWKYQSIKQGLISDLLTIGITSSREHIDTSIGLMPKEWELKTIGSIAIYVGSGVTPTGGSNVYLDYGILFIRSQNVTFDGLLLDDVAYIKEQTHKNMSRSEIFPHDVLLNTTGASIGRCCPVPDDLGEANVNQHVCAIRLPKANREDAVYLSAILESFIGQSQIDKLNAGGNRQGLNYKQLRSFFIPWAKEKERAQTAEIIESCNSTLATERENLAKLRLIKLGLMQDLLSGQVRVPPSPAFAEHARKAPPNPKADLGEGA